MIWAAGRKSAGHNAKTHRSFHYLTEFPIEDGAAARCVAGFVLRLHTHVHAHAHAHAHTCNNTHTHTHTHTHTCILSILANGILLPLRLSRTPIITLPADISRLLPRATCSLAQALSCSPFPLKGPKCDTRPSRTRRTLGDGAPDVRCGHRLPRRGRAVGALRIARQATLSFAHCCFVCWQRSDPPRGFPSVVQFFGSIPVPAGTFSGKKNCSRQTYLTLLNVVRDPLLPFAMQ